MYKFRVFSADQSFEQARNSPRQLIATRLLQFMKLVVLKAEQAELHAVFKTDTASSNIAAGRLHMTRITTHI